MTDPSIEAAELRALLELTTEQHRIKRRIDLIRGRVDERAKAEFAETGVAPTWKLPHLGQVRLDGINGEPVAYVSDEQAFADWLAQRYPTEVVATITVADVAELEAALEALQFAGVKSTTSAVVARETAADVVFKGTELVPAEPGPEDQPRWLVVDDDGEVIPGTAGRLGSPRLVVAVDAKVKSDAAAQADLEDHDSFTDLDEEGVA